MIFILTEKIWNDDAFFYLNFVILVKLSQSTTLFRVDTHMTSMKVIQYSRTRPNPPSTSKIFLSSPTLIK